MTIPPGLKFTRMSGAGNTFLIANTFDQAWSKIFPSLSEEQKADIARQACGGRADLQTDGLLFLKPKKNFDFAWDFFNLDGSKAEMCGNAARCATLFFHEKIKHTKKIHFLTSAGEISGEVLAANKIKVQMTKISDLKQMQVEGYEGLYVDTGVPHFVLPVIPSAEVAKKLRQVSDFGPRGANITFVENISSHGLKAVTFERGVENFTQACGTGAIAAAVFFQLSQGTTHLVQIRMPGGTLTVEAAIEGQRPFLIGPALIEIENLEFGESK